MKYEIPSLYLTLIVQICTIKDCIVARRWTGLSSISTSLRTLCTTSLPYNLKIGSALYSENKNRQYFRLDISIQFRSQFLWINLIYNPSFGSPATCLLNNNKWKRKPPRYPRNKSQVSRSKKLGKGIFLENAILGMPIEIDKLGKIKITLEKRWVPKTCAEKPD